MSKRRVYLGRLDVYVFESLWNLFVLLGSSGSNAKLFGDTDQPKLL